MRSYCQFLERIYKVQRKGKKEQQFQNKIGITRSCWELLKVPVIELCKGKKEQQFQNKIGITRSCWELLKVPVSNRFMSHLDGIKNYKRKGLLAIFFCVSFYLND